MKKTKSTNPERIQLIRFLRKQGRENKAMIWIDVAKYLAKSRTGHTSVNLSGINRHTQKSDVVVVPGKVLGAGSINHPVIVAAFNASKKAREKLRAAKAKYISIPDLVRKNPKGSNVKIIR